METLFTTSEVSILIRLLIAHCLADFFFQPDRWVADKSFEYGDRNFYGITAW